jgi:hypothetical protein
MFASTRSPRPASYYVRYRTDGSRMSMEHGNVALQVERELQWC